MKILFTFYVPSGGVETLNRMRCAALRNRGIETHLLYLQSGAGLQNISQIPTHVSNDDKAIAAMLQRENFDLVVVCSDYSLLERLRILGYNGPIIYEAQGLGQRKQAEETLTAGAPYISYHCKAALYPPTSHLIELFRSVLPGVRQYCFTNPLDTGQFSYRALPVSPHPAIGWVGRIEVNKNWRTFLELGYWLSQQVPGLQLWLFEDANLFDAAERSDFERLLPELNLTHRTTRFSNVPHSQMADVYSRIGDSGGFLCSTSILEGFGYAVAEAMSCRCPVLTTDSDGVRSFVTHDVTGKFYSLTDVPGAIGQAIELMRNVPLREAIRNNAEQHVRTQFSMTAYADRFIQMLREIGLAI